MHPEPTTDPTPTGLRETKKARTRASIARAALHLAATEGVQATTIEAIADHADVSPRTFFNYFESKDDAVVHLSAERFRSLIRALLAGNEPGPTGADSPTKPNPVIRMRVAMVRALAQADADSASDDRLLRAALERDPSLFGTLHTSVRQIASEFEAALATRYASTLDRDLARLGLNLALGLTQIAMLDLCDGRSEQPLHERVAHYFDLLQSALR